MKILIISTLLSITISFAQQTPLEKSNYQKLTSYDELMRFVQELDDLSDLIKVEVLGKSIEDRNLFVMKFSSSEFGSDKSKIRILIFAQQHGNEQSGKEGALLLARELLKPENKYLFDKIDFALVPQMNPDGSEKNKRRNGNDMDLNRNHLILTEPETIGLHKLFNEYLFEVTMDVHEYYPFTEEWKKFGFTKNADVQVGATTNPNVSKKIRKYSNEDYLPYIQKYLSDAGFTFQNYIVGGPPEKELIRHSTFDVNDGRQSMGIENTFSFIQEGINGKDYSTDQIKQRTESQKTGMLGLIEFVYKNKDDLLEMIKEEREALIEDCQSKVAIQMEHIKDGSKLKLNLQSVFSNLDSVITVENYCPIVKPIYEVTKPKGYLIPQNSLDLINWAEKHKIKYSPARKDKVEKFEQYFISGIDSTDFEGDKVADPQIEITCDNKEINLADYYFIPTNQLQGNLIVQALEPRSVIGLAKYKLFDYLIKKEEYYPILRVSN